MKFASMDELKQAVENNGGLLTVTMEDVRDAYGSARLGPFVLNTLQVLNSVHESLEVLGLGHLPLELPNTHTELVRLYKKDGAAGQLINAVLNLSKENDELIRQKSAG